MALPTACSGGGGGGGGGGGVPAGPPDLVAYSQNPIMATVDVPLGTVTPTVTGAVVSFSVAPVLPAGLALDPLTGVISGTATGGSLPAADYVVTVTNAEGSDVLTVVVRVLAPPVVTGYTSGNVSYEVGQPITPNAPLQTGTVDSWAVAPALPAGLSLDTTSGVISGTPASPSSRRGYTVTATNADGTDSVLVEIEVVPTIVMRLEADRTLARSDLTPATGFTPPLGGLGSSAPLLVTDTSSPSAPTFGGLLPAPAPTPPSNPTPTVTGTGASFQDATSNYSALVTFSGAPPAGWTPGCSVLPPFDFVACSLTGFTLARGDMQSAELQARVFDTLGGPNDALNTDKVNVDHYEIGQVSDISPTSNDTLLSLFTPTADGRLVLRANNSLSVAKLFVYDHAGGGSLTQLTNTRGSQNVSDGISSITGLVTLDDKLYFAADDSNTGGLRKLFQYAPGTNTLRRLSNTFPGGNDRPEEFATHNGKLYFTARNVENRRKLHSYTDAPTRAVRQVVEINVPEKDDTPTGMTSYAGKLYFVANADDQGALRKLFSYDDVTGVLTQVVDITGPASSDEPRSLFVFGGSLYFTARTSLSTISRKLFRYDSSASTLVQVSNTAGGLYSDEIEDLLVYNGKLFFTAVTNASGSIRKVFSYEPTGGGTVLRVANTAGSSSDRPEYLVLYNNRLFFRADRVGGASKLFCYDDMTATLRQVSNTTGNTAMDDDPRYLTPYGGKLYFSAWPTFAVSKLFVYDDHEGTIAQVSNTHADPTLSDAPVPRIVYGNKLLFTALDEETRIKLFALCDRATGCTLP